MIVAILLIITVSKVSAQHIANTFQVAAQAGYSMQQLDAVYPSAVSSGDKAVFKGAAQDKFITAYTYMLNGLALYLNKNKFYWGMPTRIFNRVYFAADGSINYYLVNLEKSGLDENRQKQFLSLLNTFIKTNKINITAGTRFAQCSPVIYKDIK
jgi:hypothetical protein